MNRSPMDGAVSLIRPPATNSTARTHDRLVSECRRGRPGGGFASAVVIAEGWGAWHLLLVGRRLWAAPPSESQQRLVSTPGPGTGEPEMTTPREIDSLGATSPQADDKLAADRLATSRR